MRPLEFHNSDFWDYVMERVFRGGLPEDIAKYEREESLYVLSGVSRDYILERYDDEVRDVDLVIDTQILTDKLVRKYKGHRNTFGGAKLQVNGVSVDVWPLQRTWGIVDGHMTPDVDSLLKSVFFNCTAIVYDVAKRSFFADDSFFEFVEKGILDIVYEKNPDEPLCVVNAFCYQDKYGARFSQRLTDWLIDADRFIEDYEETELRHFHKVVFPNLEIKHRVKQLKSQAISVYGLE